MGGWIYILCVAGISVQWWLQAHYLPFMGAYAYCNPLVVLASAGLIMWFSRLDLGHNKTINWISSSAFAVYLLHCPPTIGRPRFVPFFNSLYQEYSGFEYFLTAGGCLILIYAAATLLDQPRKWLWRHYFSNLLEK